MLGFESHHRSGFSLNHFHSLCGKDYEMIMILIKIRLFKTLRVVDNSFFSTHDFQDADVSKDDTASTHIILFLYFTRSICVGQLVDNSLRLQPFPWKGGYFLWITGSVVLHFAFVVTASFYCFSFRVCSFPCLSFFVRFPSVVSLTRISIACLVLCSVSSSCSPCVLFSPSFLLAYVHLRCS